MDFCFGLFVVFVFAVLFLPVWAAEHIGEDF